MKECTSLAEIFFKEENMREFDVAYHLWKIGKEAKQSMKTSIVGIMLVLHFYMELMKGKENGRK